MRYFIAMIVLGLLSGCQETEKETAARVAEQQAVDASNKVNFRCVEGYLFVERYRMGGYAGGIGLAQFWELGPDGQPRPRVCGGAHAE